MAFEAHDAWAEGYRSQGERVKQRVSRLIFESIEEDRSIAQSAALLRQHRGSLEEQFCLLLYGSKPDEEILAAVRPSVPGGLTDEEMRDAVAAGSDPERNSRIMTLLMMLLDHELGLPLVMLERQSDEPEDGPVRFRPPDELWFASFCCLAELARAIIVIGNLGPNLIHETRYLDDAGLRGRVLVYADGTLYGFERGKTLDEQRSWSLGEGGLRVAVEYAASQSTDPQ